ncbi:MAG: bifunctional UDP-N-acetylglucosamine diphosphorylase/glucosamine-1-phosphate N-acetyltransferase GlmU [Labilithrix sp.]|nr:bifunctional UDP-N-acetylglucosamine diphosphorylase/glucosamine-1-phosphate N-acetyltransferase GlmU [Labilithrix sp.]MCW5815920.1 bifunctional UDP-N-acetylglucosamine diphosphorylase/glucosamine-1-phosphate N-acetyltransferase GlmU [Labilithrix sp.]
MFEKTTAIVLAAGQGTRMKSSLPKVMHTVAGRPLVHYPVRAALDAGCANVVVVVGHGREQVEAYLAKAFGSNVTTAVQKEQRGTGDAAKAGLSGVGTSCERILLFYGDVPMLRAEDIGPVAKKLDEAPDAAVAMATCTIDDPTGYGRVLRDAKGEIVEIREHRDLETDAEKATKEWNPGIFAASRAFFEEALATLEPNNAQGEYYLTDIVAYAIEKGRRVVGVHSDAAVMDGVNDRHQLAQIDRAMVERIVKKHRVAGVTIRDGARIEDGVTIEQDATIESFAVLRGETKIGKGALVDVGCVLTNAVVDAGAALKPYSVVSDAVVRTRAQVGPFSHLRPESEVGEEAHVGNFVELKKTRLDKGAKANHLAYLGDGFVGEGANIGAGTIFCNYDGFSKHVTRIGKGAFIGSDSQLVAPVTIGDGAYVGTGTTVTKDVPPDALAIGRAKQENKEGYGPRLRARLKAEKEARAAKKT